MWLGDRWQELIFEDLNRADKAPDESLIEGLQNESQGKLFPSRHSARLGSIMAT